MVGTSHQVAPLRMLAIVFLSTSASRDDGPLGPVLAGGFESSCDLHDEGGFGGSTVFEEALGPCSVFVQIVAWLWFEVASSRHRSGR